MADPTAPVIQYKTYHFPSLPSTQDTACALLLSGDAHHGAIITCDKQTQGRGRYERPWRSMDGNLFLSLILKPQCDLTLFHHLTFITSLSLAQTIQSHVNTDANIHIKWANDVLIDDKKAAGILIETQKYQGETFAIIGMGVNITAAPKGFGCIGNDTDKPTIQDTLLTRINDHYTRWNNGRGWNVMRKNWKDYALKDNTPISITYRGQKENGLYKGINEQGHLLFKGKTGMIRTITGGDIGLINKRDK